MRIRSLVAILLASCSAPATAPKPVPPGGGTTAGGGAVTPQPSAGVTLDGLEQGRPGHGLTPDYTDEEIRREVRNFGVDKADDGTLRLEEKGTVYNEMVRTYEAADTVLNRTMLQLVYGSQHPLAYESGGYPDAIRTMTPQD